MFEPPGIWNGLWKGEADMEIKQDRVERFAQIIKGKQNVYCFGAGLALTRFLSKFRAYRIENDIKYIVDNSLEKQGTRVCCNNRDILVIPPEQMLNQITSKDVILITTAKAAEVIEQLNAQSRLENTVCYIYTILELEQYDYERMRIKIPQKLGVYQERKIPKTIHYCWFGKKEMPVQYKKWMESWKRYCPDYEIVEWNEGNYDVKKNKYIRQAYEMGKWAFVSDYARIDIVNECGGVYLDTDVELIKNIDEMLMNDAFCGFESARYVNYGLGFGAVRGNPIINDIKGFYDSISFVEENGAINQITCPAVQTHIMEQHGLVCNGEFQTLDGMTTYPPRILCGMSPNSFRLERNQKDTYAIHHYAGSWVEDHGCKKDMIAFMKRWSNSDVFFYPD